ncbi:hypothetical protein N9242_03470 [Vicingaceae bacterium]|nr:hypothetical protein [Vicingaceae bacterium]
MAEKNRASLKNLFLKGNIPKEHDFQTLIDSSINKVDDGISKSKGEGFKILAEGVNGELMSFYDNVKDLNPNWYINQKSEDGNEGLNIGEPNSGSRLFIEKGGNVGIGNTRPSTKLDVNGLITSQGRVGSYTYGELPANGEWHDVLSDLNEYNAFEIVATTGKKGAHAIMHAIAVATYGKSKPGISKTMGWFGSFRNKLDLRWTGTYFNYRLQVRTKSNYGEGVLIKYNISKLL